MKKILIFLMVLISISSVFGLDVVLNETWGTGGFDLSGCSSISQDYTCKKGSGELTSNCWNVSNYDYITSTCSIVQDNIWYGLNSHGLTGGNVFNQSNPAKVSTIDGAYMYPIGGAFGCSTPNNCRFGFANVPITTFKFGSGSSIKFSCSDFPSPSGSNAVLYLYLNFRDLDDVIPFDGITLQLSQSGSGNPAFYDGHPPEICSVYQNYSNQCTSSSPYNVEITYDYIKNSCTNWNSTLLNTFDQYDIDRVEFRTAFYTSYYAGNLDDLVITANETTEPYIIFFTPIPDPQEVNENVTWSASIGDDDPISQLWTAMDCEDDDILEYNWSMGRNPTTFVCRYNTTGTYTGRLWYSDNFHYPTNYTTTNTVEIGNITSPPSGGSCTGYVPQTCINDCVFTDNFNYNYMIQCAGWDGDYSQTHPTTNQLGVYQSTVYTRGFEMDLGTAGSVKKSQYNSYQTEFDIRLNSDKSFIFVIYNDELNKNVLDLDFNNYLVTAYKDSGSLTLATLNDGQLYHFKIVVDYSTNLVYYYIDSSLVGTINLYESGVTSSRKWQFSWANIYTEFDLDNFEISYVSVNPNSTNTTEYEPVDYSYNPSLFCAINWTGATGDKFSEANCEARGFSTEYPLISLCVPRACIQDIGLSIVSWATRNIFTTIILVTAFILIAPLAVALFRKR